MAQVRTIKKQRPAVVFAPHVETSAGIILPDDYVKAMADAVHSVGGLMVLDCIASGWVNHHDCLLFGMGGVKCDCRSAGIDMLSQGTWYEQVVV